MTERDDAQSGDLAAEVARLRAALRHQVAQSRILAELGGDYTYAFRRTPAGTDHGWITSGFTRLTGFTEEEMERRGWDTLAHPEDRPRPRTEATSLAPGESLAREYRILTKSGETRWIHDALRVAEPDDAGDVWVYGVVRDITEAKRAEATAGRLVARERAAQREAEAEWERMRELFAQVPAAIALYSGPHHVAEFVNPAYERLLGRAAAEALGKPVRVTFAEIPADAPVFQWLDQAYQTGEPVSITALPVWYDRDGDGALEEAFYDTLYQPLSDAAGGVRGVLVHAIEVTAQVRARQRDAESTQALRAERDRLQQVLDVLPVAVLIVDTTPTITVANRAVRDIMGVDLFGQPFATRDDEAFAAYGAVRDDGIPYAADQLPLARALRGEAVRGEQFLLRNVATGEQVPVLGNAAPLRDEAGAITGAVIVFQNIAALRELERTREEFLSTASHDLKGPLTSVRGYAQLAARRLGRVTGDGTAPVAAALANIEAATTRMLGIINELSDVMRVRMGVPLELRREPTDLVALARGVVEAQAYTGRDIAVEAAEPALVAAVDATRFERVLTNLIGNAIKFSPEDAPVAVRIRREGEEGDPVAAISVTDRGVGIPAEDLPTIWDRYTRAGNVSGHIAGSGLGLTSVRNIVERHGGGVQVESTVGEGSTFTVRVPLVGE